MAAIPSKAAMPDPLIPRTAGGKTLAVAIWVVYVLVMLFFALGPYTVQTGVRHGDKVLHVLAFAGVALLYPWPVSWSRLWLASLTVVALAAGIEVVQDLSPAYGRHPDLIDFLAGTAGGAAGLAARLVLAVRRENG